MPEIESATIIVDEKPIVYETLLVSEDFKSRLEAIKDKSLIAKLI
jgi:hypothetical protein